MAFELQANVVPDFGKLDRQIKQKERKANVEYDVEPKEEKDGLLSSLTGGGAAKGGAKGGAGGGIMGMLSSISGSTMAMLGGIMAIVGLVASLKPVQKMMKAIVKVMQAFMMPFALIGLRLLQPVLAYMLKILPFWYKFIQSPEKTFENAVSSGLEGLGLPEKIANPFGKISDETLLSWILPGTIGTTMLLNEIFKSGAPKNLTTWIWNKATDLWGGLIKGAGNLGNWLWNKAIGLWGTLTKGAGNFSSWIWNKVTGLWPGFKKGGDFSSWIWEKLTGIWNWSDALPKNVSSLAGWLWDQLTSALSKGLDALGGIWSEVKSWVIDKIKGLNPMNYIHIPNPFAGKTKGVEDFVVTSEGTVLETAPQDTLIGTKNPENLGGDVTINIQVDGVATDQVVDKMKRELGKEVNRIGRY